MKITKTTLDGIYVIDNIKFTDNRGSFVKIFNKDDFSDRELNFSFEEVYYSTSRKNVIRGMHFQLPPHDHEKLVHVIHGEVLDVVLDMRYESLTFGECFSINLSSDNGKSMYVSKGFAHGFLTLSESATVAYLTTTVQNSQAESGVKWNSFGFNWPVRKKAILSKRDLNLPTHKKYEMF